MSMDEQQHVALPKLYGAPAYGRPRRLAPDSPRPFDPDDLPIAAFQTDEEREIAEHVPSQSDSGHHGNPDDRHDKLGGRPFRLGRLAGRVLRSNAGHGVRSTAGE